MLGKDVFFIFHAVRVRVRFVVAENLFKRPLINISTPNLTHGVEQKLCAPFSKYKYKLY